MRLPWGFLAQGSVGVISGGVGTVATGEVGIAVSTAPGEVGTAVSDGGLAVFGPPRPNIMNRIAPNAMSTITTMPIIRIVDDPDLLDSGGGGACVGVWGGI